jgi:hypothetical protein
MVTFELEMWCGTRKVNGITSKYTAKKSSFLSSAFLRGSVARLQREEVSRSAKDHGGTGSDSTGIYMRLACFVEFSFGCKSHGKCSQSTETLLPLQIHSKSNYILLTMGLLLIASHSRYCCKGKFN